MYVQGNVGLKHLLKRPSRTSAGSSSAGTSISQSDHADGLAVWRFPCLLGDSGLTRRRPQVHWDALTAAVERTEGDIDLLLTCQWPADVAAGLGAGSAPPEGATTDGSEPLSAIAVAVRPRCLL